MPEQASQPPEPKASSAALWSAADLWIQQITQLLVFVLVGNLLGPAVVGINTMAVVAILFFATFLEGGFTDALIQKNGLERDHVDSALWLMIGFAMLETLILWLVSPLIANFYSEPELARILPLMAISLPFIAIAACYGAVLQRQLKFKQLATRSIFAYSLAFAAAFVMAHMGYGIYSLVAFFVLARVLDAALILIVSGIRPRLVIERLALQEIVDYGKHRVAHQAVTYVGSQIDRIAIGYFLGPHELGLYAIAERFVGALVNGVSGVMHRVAFPLLSAQQNDRSRFDVTFRDFLTAANLISFPVFAGLAVTSGLLIKIMFSPEWRGVVPLMTIFCLLGFLHPTFFVLTAATNAIGRPQTVLAQALITFGIKIVTVMFAAQIGTIWVVSANVGVGFVMLGVFMYLLRDLFTKSWAYYYGESARPALATLIMVLTVLTLTSTVTGFDTRVMLALAMLAGVISYIAALRVLAPELFGRALQLITNRA